jgi:hypothetical protein
MRIEENQTFKSNKIASLIVFILFTEKNNEIFVE